MKKKPDNLSTLEISMYSREKISKLTSMNNNNKNIATKLTQ